MKRPSGTAIVSALHERAGVVIGCVFGLTALLVIPFLAMAPTTSASTEPEGAVFTARNSVDANFVSGVHQVLFIVEHESGDLATAAPLIELLAVQDALRADSEIGPTLFRYFDPETGADVDGVLNLAELIRSDLAAQNIELATATDVQVKSSTASLIKRFGERSTALGLSAQASVDEAGDWTIPALVFPVLADNNVLGFGNTSVTLGGDTDAEEYGRSIQDTLRTAEGFQVNGVAIDVNLTSQEQGAIAGPFIGFTILAILLLVGLTFRSYWVLATVSVAFLALIIWLKGISNLIGLEDDLVLSLIVPVAMISFGVDFAFHAIGRYREERADGQGAPQAYVVGLTAVSGALILALVTDATAFLANLTSGIESINQFGIGAAIALASAYILLGIVTPLTVAHIEAVVPAPTPGRRAGLARVAAGGGAAALTMASALLLVFVLPWLGTIVAVATGIATLVIPFMIQRRRRDTPAVGVVPMESRDSVLAASIAKIVTALASTPQIILPTAAIVTVIAALLALQVPAKFDVEDFFAGDTDFVVGLDQVDRHVGDRGGEPALLYIEGHLTDPDNLGSLRSRVDEIRDLDVDELARDADGVIVEGGVFHVLDAAAKSPVMSDLVAQTTGVALTDENTDGIPDTAEQIEALLAVASDTGVPLDDQRLLLTPDDVRTSVNIDGPIDSTVFELGLVNSRSQESVAAARGAIEPIAAGISQDFGGSFTQLTGSPFIREASLDATNQALQVSLPVAIILCVLIAGLFLRSVRYGLVSAVPIILVVAWLYAFMYVAGYAINLVTATIAAVSIGIGVDFAIHFIVRYREELARFGLRIEAIRATAEGTGVALVASAASSAIGFAILAFAPMPLFAAYGLLTALMILMTLIATLGVLPALLYVITSDANAPDLDQEPREVLVSTNTEVRVGAHVEGARPVGL